MTVYCDPSEDLLAFVVTVILIVYNFTIHGVSFFREKNSRTVHELGKKCHPGPQTSKMHIQTPKVVNGFT